MPSSHGHLKSFLSCLAFILATVLLTSTTEAQTLTVPAGTLKPEVVKSDAPAAEPTASAATTTAPAARTLSVAPDPSKVPMDSAKFESVSVEAALLAAAPDSPSDQPPSAPATTAAAASPPAPPPICKRTLTADVVALAQPYMLNRLGASMPNALVYALRDDVMNVAGNETTDVQLRPWKRARPIVLRANEGDCLKITLTNLIKRPANPVQAASSTPPVSLHAQGMQLVNSIADDGSFVGRNNSSLATPPGVPANQKKTYTLFAQREGTFLLYSEGDTSTTGQQLFQGLFGAVNVQPAGAEWYRSQVTQEDLQLAIDRSKGNNGFTPAGQPILNYNALYPANYSDASRACHPILKMADFIYKAAADGSTCQKISNQLKLYHTDLTAIITGPNAGRFPGTTGPGPTARPEPECDKPVPPGAPFDPLFCRNPALPDRKQPYREITVIYHEVFPSASQAFNAFWDGNNPLLPVVRAGRDDFAINYGTGGIGAEIYANRIQVGPMANCVDCKYEEFFLSAWSVGDPATVVDVPANFTPTPPPPPDCQYNQLTPADTFKLGPPPQQNPTCIGRPKNDPTPGPKATIAYYPDDPSNVYHSYLDDHVKFRILHGGTGVTHIHHQHAHQWIQSPNSSDGSYLDSQFISPGASYTLEMVYNGSGNRNKTVGDSIFHCHFYPHFAEGMWAMWRVHDVFEAGTVLDASGKPAQGSRALPDAEILAGTPIPALVPLPTMPMPLMPSPVFIQNGQIVYGTPGSPDPSGQNVTQNPGFPFFIPGVAGFRAPHPPLDFAPDQLHPGQFLDGGLPRHVNTGGTSVNDQKFTVAPFTDWSKDYLTLKSRQLPEEGTHVEQIAIAYHGQRCRSTFLPDGSAANPFGPQNYPECGAASSQANFILNGLPRKTAQNPSGAQSGAPFADPAIKDDGTPAGKPRIYKAAAIQMDVTFNERGWHYQQQRLLTLWQDVLPTINRTRTCAGTSSPCPPEPFFFRANSEEDFIEYWHTNLVPNYYQVDDFQVRTPTDILGQHIHLVKFDVTSSDGAGNGWNYEDGTFAPDEVVEILHAINSPGGSWDRATFCAGCTTNLRAPQPPPPDICTGGQCKPEWMGAQTTIQRWYADPFINNNGQDNTVRTVFTHDHFGPSTHQQAGLYAGLLVEPKGSVWRSNQGDVQLGTRTDGGPTSWQARIITPNAADTYREFALEFQDFTLAYALPTDTIQIPLSKVNPAFGKPINPPPVPSLISTGGQPPPGTQTVNYFNAPVPFRTQGDCADLSYAFSSSCVRAAGLPMNGDPLTPLLRTYENDKVQVRVLVGAHTFSHFFTIGGPKWHFEPSWANSGFRSSQGMGLSEHFELLFNVPPSSIGKARTKCPDKYSTSSGDCVDYLYMPSNDDFGFVNGVWGLLRAYDPTKPFNELKPLPNNPLGPSASLDFQACPANQPADKIRTFNITAVDAKNFVPGGKIIFNSRTPNLQSLGFMYVFSEDIDPVSKKLKGPVEPLILRANAGDCIVVNLTNSLSPDADPFTSPLSWPQPFLGQALITPSKYVGLQPQLLSYDGATASGMNVGYNVLPQTVSPGKTSTFKWYAGNIERNQTGALIYTPVEFGSLNLLPTDPLMQHQWALFGGMVIEPAGAKWRCDADGTGKIQVPCEPGTPGYDPTKVKTRASASVTNATGATLFRDFVAMVNEDLLLNSSNRSGINYRTEPTPYRYGNINPDPPTFAANGDNTCAISNTLLPGNPLSAATDPQTPIFNAKVGTPVRFRLMHPQGTGTAQVFTINGHVWQREPYLGGSAVIGNNVLSQWLGSHDSHGSTDHFDIVIDKAGGQFGVLGDYLYTTFLPNQNALGSWGIFRVLDKNGNPVVPPTTPVCPAIPPNPKPRAPDRDQNDFIRQPFGKAIRQLNNM